MNVEVSIFISKDKEVLLDNNLVTLSMGRMTQEDIDDGCKHLQGLKTHLDKRK